VRSGRLNAAWDTATPILTRPGRPMFRPPVRTLYLDFETHLYDLGGRNSEIRGREIGAEVNHGEQDFLQTALPDASLPPITITHWKKYGS